MQKQYDQQQNIKKITCCNTITPVLSNKYYEMKKNSNYTNNETINTTMISKAFALTAKQSTNHLKEKLLKLDQEQEPSYIIEQRKGLFIKDEDEEDDLEEDDDEGVNDVDKTEDFNECQNTNEYFDTLSPNSSFQTYSNNSSGFSTPTNNKNDELNNDLSQDLNYLSNQLISSQLTTTIRAASAAFADILYCPKKRQVGYSNFDLNEKRTFHILSERRRRYDLKKLFENLRTNIPCLLNKQKASKVTILKTAVEHLNEISHRNDQLKRTHHLETLKQRELIQYLRQLQQEKNQFYSNSSDKI